MSDTTPDTQPDEVFQGEIAVVCCWGGAAPISLGFDVERKVIYLPMPAGRRWFEPTLGGGVQIEYVAELPAGATPCEEFGECVKEVLMAHHLVPQPIAALVNLADGSLVAGDNLPMLQPAR
jgi:hypothetical protein